MESGESALRRARRARGESRAAAARRIGVNPLTYRLWERGLLLPDLRWARSISDYTGLDLADVCAILLKLRGQLHAEQYLVIRRRNRRDALPQWPQLPVIAASPSPVRGRTPRGAVIRLGTAAAVASLAVGSLGAAASVGVLPDPLQRVLAQTARTLGIHLPDAEAQAPSFDGRRTLPPEWPDARQAAGRAPTPSHRPTPPHSPVPAAKHTPAAASAGAGRAQPAAPAETPGSPPPTAPPAAPPAETPGSPPPTAPPAAPPAEQPTAVPPAPPSPSPSESRAPRTVGAPSERPSVDPAARSRAAQPGDGTSPGPQLPTLPGEVGSTPPVPLSPRDRTRPSPALS